LDGDRALLAALQRNALAAARDFSPSVTAEAYEKLFLEVVR
jgi:hypothetical protein